MANSICFLALDRDDARRLFGLADDDGRWEFVNQMAQNVAGQREQRVLVCGPAWQVVQRLLGDGAAYPWDHCVLGGRELQRDAARRSIVLKRPDTVSHLADALGSVLEDDLRRKFFSYDNFVILNGEPSEEYFQRAWGVVEALRAFYRRAAEDKCAVALAIEPKA